MRFANIKLGSEVEIDPSTSINNVIIEDGVRIAKRCSIFGGPDNQLELRKNSYVGMNSILNGFAAKLIIGENVSISQFVNIMVDSGPNASEGMQHIFPIEKGPIEIGNDCWIGASAIIMPNVSLGEYCVVASNSFVNKSFPSFSIIGGTPARLIRTFTDAEKEKMLSKENEDVDSEKSIYEYNYLNLPFENVLHKFRVKNIIKILERFPHRNFLEIGCGPNPLFTSIKDFDRMVVIEPAKRFFDIAKLLAKSHSNIFIINDLIENIVDILHKETFNFIVLGGFLHEIDNPEIVLESVRKICSKDTIVYSYVPNAKSFHRLLAYNMNLTESIYQKSAHDELFNRCRVYDIESYIKLFSESKFKNLESGSYFIKPFSHDQMNKLIENRIIDESCFDGLDKIIEFMPGLGSELWNISKIDD
jgi:acetyltransferase-like isoleucine patch superfamily enzyme/SAM-dependent methyltransferase